MTINNIKTFEIGSMCCYTVVPMCLYLYRLNMACHSLHQNIIDYNINHNKFKLAVKICRNDFKIDPEPHGGDRILFRSDLQRMH